LGNAGAELDGGAEHDGILALGDAGPNIVPYREVPWCVRVKGLPLTKIIGAQKYKISTTNIKSNF